MNRQSGIIEVEDDVMPTCIHKNTLVTLVTFLLLMYPGRLAAASPTMTLPASLQAETGQDFSIPVTVQAGNVALVVYELRAFAEAGNVTVESRSINRAVPANSTASFSLAGSAFTSGIARVTIEARVQPEASSNPITLIGEVLVEVNDPAAQQARPRLSVAGVSFTPASPDLTQAFTLNISLHNSGESAARNLVASLDGGKNFTVTTLTNTVNLQAVERGTTVVASFQVRALKTRESNQVTLNLSYGTHSQAETLNLPLPAARPPEFLEPVLKADSFNLRPSKDGQFMLSLTVRNSGKTEAAKIEATLDGGDRVFPALGGNSRTISALAPGGAAVAEFLLKSRGALAGHPVNLTFDFVNPDGDKLKNSDRIFISANFEPALRISGFSASPEGDDGRFLLNLRLQNEGGSTARDIAVRFTGNQAFPLDGSDLVPVPDLAAGSSGRLSLVMLPAARSETYSIPVEISYRSAAGAEHKANETITLPASAAGGRRQGTPRVMLEKHALSTGQVLAGGSFTLTLTFRNNAARPVENIKISLGSIQVGTGAGGTGNTGGTVFSPLDGSGGSFFVDRLAANARLAKEVKLFVDPNATAMTYALPITIEYEDGEGKPFSVNETVNVPVLQESRLQVLSLELPAQALAGQPVPVSMEFANTGRVTLNNVLVSIEGDFGKENATYFVPRLEIGKSDFFQGMIIPATAGTLSGNLTVTFLDGRNQEVRLDHPFTLEVQAMEVTPELPTPDLVQPAAASPLIPVLWGVIAVAAVATIALVIRKIASRRRKAFFDEQG